MFLDHATVDVEAGDGGNGACAFRREAMVPHGGPSGGDGGRGGDVRIRADEQLSTLLDFRYRRHYRAERGGHGSGSRRTGADGDDLTLLVPPGTIVRNADSGEVLADVVRAGDTAVVARGGRGGRGNARFATSTNQAPRRWEPGRPGETRQVEFELKLIADVGLVGEPNAGKSTLLASVSKATPRIADYPFTTLRPNLGVVQRSGGRTFVVADIPGIIEGAHEGKGLGHRFLRHIERTRTLAVVVASDALDVQQTYDSLRIELAQYAPELAAKPHCVVFSKADLLPEDWDPPRVRASEAWGQFAVSSVSRRGLDELLDRLWDAVRERRHANAATGRGVDDDPLNR